RRAPPNGTAGGRLQSRDGAAPRVRPSVMTFYNPRVRRWKHAWRQLLSAPVFSIAAVISLALGIGANTAIFTLANAILFRPIAASDPHRLVRVAASEPGGRP